MTLLELAERCEVANETQEASLLCEAYGLIFGWLPKDMPLREMPEGALERQARFSRLMDALASLDAAMTLIPEGWRYAGSETSQGDWYAHLITRNYSSDHCTRLHAEATAATGPLSICAAALRARAGGEQ